MESCHQVFELQQHKQQHTADTCHTVQLWLRFAMSCRALHTPTTPQSINQCYSSYEAQKAHASHSLTLRRRNNQLIENPLSIESKLIYMAA